MAHLTVDKRGRVTLPEEVRRELGLKEGESSLVLIDRTEHGTFELLPAEVVPRDQLWFYHPDVYERVAGAEADFMEGRMVEADTPEEARAYLDALKEDE